MPTMLAGHTDTARRSAHRSLITGATGFVGAWLLHRLLAEGDDVAILVRSSSDLWRLGPATDRVTRIESSLQDIRSAADQIRQFAPDRIFHLAWTGGNSAKHNDDPAQVYANVPGSLDLLQIAADSGANFFLNLGSCVEYGTFRVPVSETDPVHPLNLYGAAKHAVEDLALRLAPQLGLRAASVRLFWAYGPGDDDARLVPSLTKKLLANQRHSMTPGTQLWDFVYIDDVIDALLALANTPIAEGVFNLGSGTARPLRDVAELIRRQAEATAELGFGDLPFPPNQVMHLQANIARLSSATNWSPKTPLEDGIAKTVQWYKHGTRTLPTQHLK